jgi:phospholipid/cholesterol/gamma-HCH transport system ATP-binding protein
VVSYDAAESMRIIDYVYLISDGVVAAQGAAAQLRDSRDPFVRQFLDGTPDGPVPFHYAHDPYRADLGIDTARVN